MQICLIAPVSMLDTCIGMPYQMVIPEGLAYAEYQQYFRSMAQPLKPPIFKKTVMLDNGAWETETASPTLLVDMALDFGVTEVIVPDVITSEPNSTLELMERFFSTISPEILLEHQLRYAAVIHGSSLEDCKFFIDVVAEEFPFISTLCAAKKLPEHCNDSEIRLEIGEFLYETYEERFDYHLLGYNEHLRSEMLTRARSLDTTAPFTCALEGHTIYDDIRVPRPPGYFGLAREAFDEQLVHHNIAYMTNVGEENA